MIARFLKIKGRVQRVGFRFSSKLMAGRFGVMGWTKNIDDGSVEIFVQGEPEKVQKFINWAKHGPPWARVDQIDVRDQTPDSRITAFNILY